jgi:hypothetical protein
MPHRMVRIESGVYAQLASLRSRPGEPISEVVSRLMRGMPSAARSERIFESLVAESGSRWSPSEDELDRLEALQAIPRPRSSRVEHEGGADE